MISYARQNPEQQLDDEIPPPADDHIAPAPRVSVQAFCETVETAAAVQLACEDRRLGKAHLRIHMGGMAAAIEAYRTAPTPNVIILETEGRGRMLAGLDRRASVCDSGTRVVVIGRVNDVTLYRELVRRGVSDYVIVPIGALDVVRAICGLFSAPEAKAVGRIIAIVGAKGGVGASTIAHNVAWAIARDLALDSVVADLDLAFGTAGLDYNQDPPQGIADAVFSPDRVDTAFVDRLLSKCTDHLSLLAAPATLDRVYDFGVEAFDSIFDTLRTTISCSSQHLISPICATPRTCSTCSSRRGRTTGPRYTASIRSGCRSGRKSIRANSPRRSKVSRSPPFRSIRRCSVRLPTTAR